MSLQPPHLPLASRDAALDCAASSECPGWCASARPPEVPTSSAIHRSHAPLRPGELIDDTWRLIHRLGEGGTAEVWLARDPVRHRDVALKLLRGPLVCNREMTDRFAMEARALARVRHPNVVRLLGRGISRGRPFIVMDHVVGVDLSALLAALGPRHLPLGRALGILRGVLAGVAAMHAAGVLHGDIKPANVIVTPDRIMLVDLGLAHPLASVCRNRRDAVFGTPRYLAPELAAGIAHCPDAVTDVYAAATLAFELLTGRAPFAADTVEESLRAQIESPVPPPSQLRPGLPHALELALLRGLEKSPMRRTASIEQLHAELMSGGGGHVFAAR